MNKEKKLEKVLELVNGARVALGIKPLKTLRRGYQRHIANCPIACSIPYSCVVTEYWIKFETVNHAIKVAKAWGKTRYVDEVKLPVALASFVRSFDNWEYPELLRSSK